jgi:hypothetical protein
VGNHPTGILSPAFLVRYEKKYRMIHYTCDRCQREIETDAEVRYSINIQIKAEFDSSDCHDCPPIDGDEADHLLELHEILERLDEEETPLPRDSGCAQRCFDLCSDCYKVYNRNPLARDIPVAIQFSEN